MMTHYELFDLDPWASFETIKTRYLFFAKAFHPDRFQSVPDKQQAEACFKRVQAAYQVLDNPVLREQYDRQLAAAPSLWVKALKLAEPWLRLAQEPRVSRPRPRPRRKR